ncbi:hydrophobin 1 [Moniliophthora roreri MCA 2997]|uniref:Hydrophobin n=2 Tax=Moniliophthora roreri TaxID=221103 RepID=V2YD27_MONRO|nr:hydrophobin 1 [Moniliophthora roreri MCA 2997]KAI3611523.1 hydrophobin 1 [Moniliophthora roreri]
MFTKSVAFALTTFSVLAAAHECSTGPVQCCNSVQAADTPAVAELLTTVSVAIQGVTGQVGVTCTPISVIGGGSNNCNGQTVCCENNNFNDAVALGCTPINVSL